MRWRFAAANQKTAAAKRPLIILNRRMAAVKRAR